MLVKCETKSQRVKSISFHPKIDLVLAGLHNGIIQLWNYRIGILINKFEEHEGPVRGICFHSAQPLFVSGADDYLIKVWNIHLKKCVFNLTGHLDYIRTVQFHLSYPWILSASDDQTIRIWNWQSRVCIAILTGHNHYVMSAEFHPVYDMIISGSLDKTIRVWDIKLLREKNVIHSNNMNSSNDGIPGVGSISEKPYGLDVSNSLLGVNIDNGMNSHFMGSSLHHQNSNNNMFGASDAICKFILDGHEKGINCCTFHHNLPIIASGSDDKLIKLWRYNDSKCWELDTLRGHFNNVSSLLFHKNNDDLLLSNSEDRTMRIWDITKRVCIHTFRRENDRFWVLTFKPNSNLIASGHDSGMVIFKFDKEKCPYDKNENSLFYCKDKQVVMYNIYTNEYVNMFPVKKNTNPMVSNYYKLFVNNFCTTHIAIIFLYKEEDKFFYDLIICNGINTGSNNSNRNLSQPFSNSPFGVLKSWVKRGNISTIKPASENDTPFNTESVNYIIKNKSCIYATFFSRNKYIFVEKKNINNGINNTSFSYIINIHNFPDDNLYKRIEVYFKIEHIYSLNNNKIIICSENKIYLYDINLKSILNEMHHTDIITSVEIVKEYIAFVFKYNIVITTIDLNHLCTVHENIRIKTGTWDSCGNKNVFIYNTHTHLKYLLTNGEKGLIKYMKESVYLFKVYNNKIYYINRKHNIISDKLNDTEYMFKLALINNDEAMAYYYLEMYRNSQNKIENNNGKKSIYFSYNLIGYIKKKGFANLVLQIVNNNHIIFNMSIQLGHIENALKAAKKIDKKHIWNILSNHALLLGNYEIAEYSLQKIKAYDKLSFLYFFSGNIEKLKKMLSISLLRKDFISTFLNSLYIGDIEQRINIFIQQNQCNLALLCSNLYNIPINLSEKEFGFDVTNCNYIPTKSFYLSPPIPLIKIKENSEKNGDPNLTYWNSSYNWPVKVIENTQNYYYTAQENKIKETDKIKYKEQIGNINSNNNDLLINNQTHINSRINKLDNNPNYYNNIDKKYDDKNSSLDDNNDIWKDDVNDDDINIDLPENHDNNLFNLNNNNKGGKIVRGENMILKGLKKNGKISDHIKAGNIQIGLKLISKKYGIINMKPFKQIIKNVYISTYAYITPIQNFIPLKIPININEYNLPGHVHNNTNTTYITKNFLFNQVKKAHKLVTQGKFPSALSLFRNILYSMIFVNTNENENENEKELNEYLNMCTNYILAMRLEEERNVTSNDDPRRSLELMAYFTCCSLQNSHLYLVLRRGMGLAWKAQNYITAGSFAKRLINGNYENIKGSDEEIIKAKKILIVCEQKSTEQYNIDYDPNDYHNIKICSMSLTKINPNEEIVTCPFCHSIAKKSFASKLCSNCIVAQLGIKALGFDFLNKNI
ncbi:coatomer alpha subunit, putative [Plasmodium berghei]|uniref:Coatomer alpha subunit, putative n=2 Tax=Plasmodium berghei TaxID=5821 RepID=A0A509AAJ9_PLABA|nr:coatomer alpha subunit, putative [Plasmodium berghei ANKA]CXH81066.1 coatomer alpha subunit, putative [Plasmodium berghei]SCM19094.1 coatomer alpha subunit, putative [Plasmodium berghei]SCN21593.1 coatomer alpha subunit, putative [Plasmodium berghei]SCO58880.1 coatomer alpha subunit, putative [Plasmodium berghei]VUC53789.1 coatomer alpha subunit, putative [Plasmodium berghei ANKA]|eukprot:XP_034419653.1 coatomer alpha subunit, putative [Plasmodium berghei ANKA]